jgi:hypothetical protein
VQLSFLAFDLHAASYPKYLGFRVYVCHLRAASARSHHQVTRVTCRHSHSPHPLETAVREEWCHKGVDVSWCGEVEGERGGDVCYGGCGRVTGLVKLALDIELDT